MRSLQQHLDEPALGEPPLTGPDAAAATDGCAGGSCGVLAHYWLVVDDDGVIRDCTARVRGRAAAFATASALCEAARGRTIVDAALLGLGTLHPSFAAIDDEDRERALVAEDGFHHALGRWLLARMRDAPPGTGADRPDIVPAVRDAGAAVLRAVVGMSGGVDSAVALHRTIDTHGTAHVAGATLRLWIDPRAPDPDAACCSPDSVRRARATCHAAGVPHLSIDLREDFARAVVVPFVTEYASGATPNPCVRCNGRFRLDELVRLADVVGAEEVVTGHYARRVERGGRWLIARGVDRSKDQSYMLGQVHPATTARLRFPLGAEHKTDVRADATRRGLVQATLAESQEVCFLGGGDYRTFLGRAGALGRPGEIVRVEESSDGDGTTTERVVGTHEGIAGFTPGQRRGIGVAAERPLYVLDVDPDSGRVLVGDGDSLATRTVPVAELRWFASDQPEHVTAQLRYRMHGGGVPVRVLSDDTGAAEIDAVLELDAALRAPAPGQTAVLYDDDVVVGTARILRTPVQVRTAALAAARADR